MSRAKKEGLRLLPPIRAGLTATEGQLQALADFWSLLANAASTGAWPAVRPVLEDFHKKGGMADWLFNGPPIRLDCLADAVCAFTLKGDCDGDHSEHCEEGETACRDAECTACATGMCRDEHAEKSQPKTCGGCKAGMEADDECRDCGDCSDCCFDNHGGEPHTPGGA
jgi:hypothetical protein